MGLSSQFGRKKGVCSRCGIVSHRVKQCGFFPARRPVQKNNTVTTITTTTVPNIITNENESDSGKKLVFDQKRAKIKCFSQSGFGAKMELISEKDGRAISEHRQNKMVHKIRREKKLPQDTDN